MNNLYNYFDNKLYNTNNFTLFVYIVQCFEVYKNLQVA